MFSFPLLVTYKLLIYGARLEIESFHVQCTHRIGDSLLGVPYVIMKIIILGMNVDGILCFLHLRTSQGIFSSKEFFSNGSDFCHETLLYPIYILN